MEDAFQFWSPKMRITLGEELRSLREAKGWDLFEASRRTGITIATLSGYESGRAPTLINLTKLARAFEISLSRFDGVERPALQPVA
jgi:transcriptional regulator with XRE-family HTH domain